MRKLKRLTEMSLPEIRFRVAQRARISQEKWRLWRTGTAQEHANLCDLWDPAQVGNAALRSALISRRPDAAVPMLPAYLAHRRSPIFFVGPTELQNILECFPVLFPTRSAEIQAEADALSSLKVKIFSYPEISCAGNVPWRADLIHSVESDLQHHASIPFLDFSKVGDSKLVWEPNRHQYFLTLCLASLLLRQEKYAEALLNQWENWLDENPYAQGINWSSSLEVAFRSWSWLWALHLLSGSRVLTGERIARFTTALARNARFISENLSTYFSPNTHLIGEGFALFCSGVAFPELRGADKWRDNGRTILIDEMAKQVREDGSHFEQSSSYHRYTAEFFLCATILAERNGLSFPDSFQRKLLKMFEFLQAITAPGGSDPTFGDADGGRLIPFGPNEPRDFSAILSTAAVYFRRGDFKATAGAFHEQTLWLLGPKSPALFDSLPLEHPEETSRSFPSSGIVVMRSSSPGSKSLLFDAGVQGMGNSGHGHADSLSVVCSSDGIEWLVDPGTYVYTASRAWRDFFRSTRAHNTVSVDGCDQATPVDFFKWTDMPAVSLERFVSLPDIDRAVGSHNGYARLSDPLLHRRRITFVKPDYWLISDELQGTGTHDLEFSFHFAPGVELRNAQNFCLATKQDRSFALLADAPGLDFRIACGEESPTQGWYSRDYGVREPAPVLLAKGRAATPATFNWLLMPNPPKQLNLSRLSQTSSEFCLEADDYADILRTSRPEGTNSGVISSDADLLLLRRHGSGRLLRLVLAHGSTVESENQNIFQSQSTLDHFTLSQYDSHLDIHLHPSAPFRLYSPETISMTVNGTPVPLHRDGPWIVFKEAS